MKRLLLLVAILAMVSAVSAADTTTLDPGTAVDWNIWILSGIIGLVLFLLSLRAMANTAEVEMDIIISFMAWAPIAYCANSAFAVSRIVSTGTITVYSYWVVGVVTWVFFIAAIINTLRLIAMHRILAGKQEQNRGLNE